MDNEIESHFNRGSIWFNFHAYSIAYYFVSIKLLEGIHAVPMTEEMFESWLDSHHYTFINFYAPWCVWCQRLEPVWEAFAERVEAEDLPVSIVRMDCIANKDLCMKLKIQVNIVH